MAVAMVIVPIIVRVTVALIVLWASRKSNKQLVHSSPKAKAVGNDQPAVLHQLHSWDDLHQPRFSTVFCKCIVQQLVQRFLQKM